MSAFIDNYSDKLSEGSAYSAVSGASAYSIQKDPVTGVDTKKVKKKKKKKKKKRPTNNQSVLSNRAAGLVLDQIDERLAEESDPEEDSTPQARTRSAAKQRNDKRTLGLVTVPEESKEHNLSSFRDDTRRVTSTTHQELVELQSADLNAKLQEDDDFEVVSSPFGVEDPPVMNESPQVKMQAHRHQTQMQTSKAASQTASQVDRTTSRQSPDPEYRV